MDQSLTLFAAPTAHWFEETVGTPTAVQREAWPAIATGAHVLVSAPTGTGKTLSAFLWYIDALKAQARQGALEDQLHLVYISPLKALGNDIRENLRRPLEGIEGPELRVAVRTGDTPATERQRMARRPPHVLITTPESLYLLLTSRSGRQMLHTARAVILDELHALMGSKRGAHLMYSLARLDKLCGQPLQRIGLSATIDPLSTAADYLGYPHTARIIAPPMRKAVDIEVNSPLPDMRALPEGTVWPELGRVVYEHCEGKRTVIAFVEGRAQAERLAYYVNLLGGEQFARTHHGSISKEQRLEAEQLLRGGQLRLLCATSSMELGIDVGEIDLVLQIGTPRTISSTMQRLGRAGHNPGRTSVMHIFPRTAAEGIPCGLTAHVALEGGIEQVHPPRLCLDVLAQHLVSMSAMESYTVDEALALTQQVYCFREVEREVFCSVLRMLAGDYEHQADRPARPRLLYDRIHGTVSGDAYSRMLALSAGGTIPDRGLFTVRSADGTRLGELDEEFVFEARVGDKFLLGAFAWRITSIQKESVVVAPASTEGAQSPFWKGDGSGRTYQTGLAFGALMRNLGEAHHGRKLPQALRKLRLDDAAVRNAAEFLARQFESTHALPDDRTLLIEHYTGPSGEHQMMVHSLFGRRVNAGLAMLVEAMARQDTGMDLRCFDEDDGFLVYPYGGTLPLPMGLLQRLQPHNARAMLSALLPATPLFNMTFRYNAGRALMMGVRSGRRVPLWVQRLRGAQVLDDAVLHQDHPLIAETRRECLEDYFDIDAIEQVLRDIQRGAIDIRELRLDSPSPMSLPFRRAAEAEFMYDYFPKTSAVHRNVEEALTAAQMLPPSQAQLEQVATRSKQPTSAEQLHALLMAEGDLIAGEVDAPVSWLQTLAGQDRALYVEPGLWICAEQRALYEAALVLEDAPARLRITRRCLRYRGAHNAQTLSGRYLWPPEASQRLLDELVTAEIAILENGLYYHTDVYSRAQHATIAQRRAEVRTLPPERYAALMAHRLRPGAEPLAQLRQGIESLLGQAHPPALWENALLPARVGGYRPALLDTLLQEGEYHWLIEPWDKPLLAFHRCADIDWAQPAAAQDASLEEDEQRIVEALAQRGASFAQGLSGILGSKSPVPVLQTLAAKGLARADSFLPVRQWLGSDKGERTAKVRAMARAQSAMTGRWELTRPLRPCSAEEHVQRAFNRSPLLCRETVEGLPWAQALDILRIWEYTGQVRRGYFIRGLSGAQFVRNSDYASVMAQLTSPLEETVWLHAADPAQMWGKALSHEPDAEFMRVPGTAVALRAGQPVAVLERQGSTLRVLAPEHLPDALAALGRDFHAGRIFSAQERITIKQYPQEAPELLAAAGFARVVLDYTLWKSRL